MIITKVDKSLPDSHPNCFYNSMLNTYNHFTGDHKNC